MINFNFNTNLLKIVCDLNKLSTNKIKIGYSNKHYFRKFEELIPNLKIIDNTIIRKIVVSNEQLYPSKTNALIINHISIADLVIQVVITVSKNEEDMVSFSYCLETYNANYKQLFYLKIFVMIILLKRVILKNHYHLFCVTES